MNETLYQLFRQYCEHKNWSLTQTTQIEEAIRSFTESITHDLLRAYYLNQLTDHPVERPDPIQVAQSLLSQVPLHDLQLQRARDHKFGLGDDLLKILSLEEKLYALSQLPLCNRLLQKPTPGSAPFDFKGINLNEWQQYVLQAQKISHFDAVYCQSLQSFVKLLQQGVTVQKASQPVEPIQDQIVPVVYGLSRRGKIGLELVDLVRKGRLSYLSYVQTITTDGDQFDKTLKQGFLLSQLDAMHDCQLIDTSLFAQLRKQPPQQVEQELEARLHMIDLLKELNERHWIDAKQIETVLKNSRTRPAAKLLETLEIYKIKKVLGELVRQQVHGTPQEAEAMKRLTQLIKQVENLKAFGDYLGGETEWSNLGARFTAEEILQHLAEFSQHPQAYRHGTVPKFKKLQNKVLTDLRPSQQSAPSNASDASSSRPNANSKAHPPSSAKPQPSPKASESASPQGSPILTNVHSFKKEIQKAVQEHALSTESGRLFTQKLNLLEQRLTLSNPVPAEQAQALLSKWRDEIQQATELDTQIHELIESLKKDSAQWHLTSEELFELRNVDIPFPERKAWVRVCTEKYSLLQELYEKYDESRLEDLHYETLSPFVLYLFQDLLRKAPFAFAEQDLTSLHEAVPHDDLQRLEACRSMLAELFKASVSVVFLLKLLYWGIGNLPLTELNRLRQILVGGIRTAHQYSIDWRAWKTQALSIELVKEILQGMADFHRHYMDAQGKKIVQKIQEGLDSEEGLDLSEIEPEELETLVHSVATTEYFAKLMEITNTLKESTSSVNIPSEKLSDVKSPVELLQRIERIETIGFYEQRLELLIDQAIAVFTEMNPFVDAGKQLYEELVGFEY